MEVQSRSGSIMLELVVVTALIGTTALSIVGSLLYGQSANARANNFAEASYIAGQEMEIIRTTAYADLTVPYDGDFLGRPDDPASKLPSGSGNLVMSYFDDPTNTIKQAVITVSWVEHGQNRSLEYTTLMTSGGIY